ncbi:MAG: hypothetical protein K8T25_02230 [Planctomycetia bacterium]|nr:hypothetical protein [Planctomycetia bacterium]
MSENPYQSPLSPELGGAAPTTADALADNRRGRSPLLMAPIGVLLGAMVAALTGCFGGCIVGIVYVQIYPSLADFPTIGHNASLFIVYWTMGGGYVGSVAGGMLGGALGMAAALFRSGSRPKFVMGATSAAAAVGGCLGLDAILITTNQPSGAWNGAPPNASWSIVGLFAGALLGVLVGRVLGVLLANICWGRSGRQVSSE